MDNKPEVSWGWLLNLFQSILIFLVALDFNFLAQGTSEIFCGIEGNHAKPAHHDFAQRVSRAYALSCPPVIALASKFSSPYLI